MVVIRISGQNGDNETRVSDQSNLLMISEKLWSGMIYTSFNSLWFIIQISNQISVTVEKAIPQAKPSKSQLGQ